ncbi:hypothetical protein [Prosthecodimorpha staleyi]|uniref:Uncharacterized protein n=1 Tax=Prosthecodimorpha staleyi TaxID=2840188 RepID=A0A947GDT9_9HYPH|nr:hypothetical protein [Prosthecodimorpha staleyi]MBT9290661.1 hypothetical protein [Prosthecodimorpha staleyi]
MNKTLAALALLAGLVAGAPMPPAASAEAGTDEAARIARCLTGEGGNYEAGKGATVPEACRALDRDETVCDALDGKAFLECVARRVALWDKVLDRLAVALADQKGSAAALRGLTAGFRAHRAAACRFYERYGVAEESPRLVPRCRLRLTIAFARETYQSLFLP